MTYLCIVHVRLCRLQVFEADALPLTPPGGGAPCGSLHVQLYSS